LGEEVIGVLVLVAGIHGAQIHSVGPPGPGGRESHRPGVGPRLILSSAPPPLKRARPRPEAVRRRAARASGLWTRSSQERRTMTRTLRGAWLAALLAPWLWPAARAGGDE